MRHIYPLTPRFIMPFAFLLAVSLLAVSLLFILPSGSLHAQTSTIEYPENGTGQVATFTAVDPEGKPVVWSLADGEDNGDFDIENGVLRFKSSPDYEIPVDADTNNTYQVTVQASDGGAETTTAMQAVTIDVTNVEEPGTVTLSTLQPQLGVRITVTLTDPDEADTVDPTGAVSAATWQWYSDGSLIPGATDAFYTPVGGDVGSVVRATAMYDDGEGADKTAQADSVHAVREAPESNVPPTFPTTVGQMNTNQTREVAENTPSGTNLGAPVAASDPGDVLTYSLSGTNAALFSINRATGQLSTKTKLDYEDTAQRMLQVMVTATDPFGDPDPPVMATVMVTVTDVNEAPTLTGDASIDHAESNDPTVTPLATGSSEYTAADADDADNTDDLDWSLAGADSSKFSITGTGATRTLSFKANPDYESPGDSNRNNVYEVTVVVTDSKGNSAEQDVTVKVTNVEEDGTVTLFPLQPQVDVRVTATLADPDNVTVSSVSWQWYRGDSAEDASECADATSDDCFIKGATSATYTPVADDATKTLTAVATYTDGLGDAVAAGTLENDIVVLADPRNKAPVFPDQDSRTDGFQTDQKRTADENTALDMVLKTITPERATDGDDAVLTYSLGGADAASFSINPADGVLTAKGQLDYETKDTYTVTVTAEDSLNARSTITVTIKLTDLDEIPKLEGDAPARYAENGTGQVATFTAVDPEGKSITWDLDGEDAADFSIENGVLRFENSPDFETPADNNSDNTYAVTIQASDGRTTDGTATKAVTIDVTNVEEPGTVTLSTLQPQLGEVITATLADPDNALSTISWQWSHGTRAITTNATDGAGTIMSSYTPVAGDGGRGLRAKAMYADGEGVDKTAQADSYRNIRNAPSTNTAPLFPGGTVPQTRKVAENMPAGTNLGAAFTASDSGDVLTYSLSGTNEALFSINRATGQLSTKAKLDYEDTAQVGSDGVLDVIVTATDPFGALAMVTVMVTLTDVNEAPTLTGDASIDHAESNLETVTALDISADTDVQAAVYTATDPDAADMDDDLDWSLSGADASKFQFDQNDLTGATRTLEFKANPDFESPGDSNRNNVYEVTVVVTDTKGNSAEKDVTVKVTNVEEPGVVTLSTLQPRVDVPVTATLADPDNVTVSSVSWQWYRGTFAAEARECAADATSDNCFIKGATSATYTPVADDADDTSGTAKILNAVATYTDGSGDAEDVAMGAAVNVVLEDSRNKAPVFPDQDPTTDGRQTDQERTADENTALDMDLRTIGLPVVATDGDDTLTYSLGGADAASFSISSVAVPGIGQLTAKGQLDYETKNTYTVIVTATDPSGETGMVTVTITVTNVDEAPTITRGGLSISGATRPRYAENDTGTVATYRAIGSNAASATWTLAGADAGDFRISSSGVLTFPRSPNYEAPADADTDNVYQVTVRASDRRYNAMLAVTVSVTDEFEAPFVPRAPNVAPTAGEPTSLDVSWTAPSNGGGPDITSYDLQYRIGDSGNFIAGLQNVTETSTIIAGLTEDTSYEVQVRATNDEGDSDWSTAGMGSTGTSGNNAPVFPAAAYTRSVAEDTLADTDIGAAIPAATDLDGDPLTYTMEGTDEASFTFDASTRQIKTSADLDFEVKASYSVTIKVSDGTDSDTVVVTITVTEVDEMAPEMSLLDRYDANDDNRIDKSEVLAAVDDYIFNQTITREMVLEVVELYIFG